jgi:F0F1-type ATP synthase assembly protein I
MAEPSSTTTATASYDPATQPKRPDESLGQLFGDMTRDLGDLFRKELELAKTEARDEARDMAKAGTKFGVAALGGWLAVLFVSLCVAWLLDQAINRALAFLIVGIVWAVVAAVAASAGRKQLKQVRPLPTTVETLREDARWVKEQKS